MVVSSTRQVQYRSEVGQGSKTQGTATTQDTHPPPPPLAPVLAPVLAPAPLAAPLMIGAEQLQQLLGGAPRADDFAKATKNYISYGGTRFDGLGGALNALAWVEGCEEAFEHMPLSSVQRRGLATQNLDGAALQWWKAIRAGLDLAVFGWEAFLLRFHAKFVPLSERNKLSEEFLSLRQGAFTATAVINRFNALSRFCPSMVDTEEKRVERILHCLSPQLALQCQHARGRTFDETCDIILCSE